MERHAFAMKIKDGKMNDYRRKLGEIWQELYESVYKKKGKLPHNFNFRAN